MNTAVEIQIKLREGAETLNILKRYVDDKLVEMMDNGKMEELIDDTINYKRCRIWRPDTSSVNLPVFAKDTVKVRRPPDFDRKGDRP